MSGQFAGCLCLALACHASLLLFLPAVLPSSLPRSSGSFCIEVEPAPQLVASAHQVKQSKTPRKRVQPNEFRVTQRPVEPETPRQEETRPLDRPERPVSPASDVEPPEPHVTTATADVELEPIEVPMDSSLSPSLASPQSAPAPLAEKGGKSAPRLASAFHPVFPEGARERGEHGLVVLVVEISETGKVVAARVAKSSGYESLDRAALRDIRAAKFEPGRVGGEPIPMSVRLPIRYFFSD